MGKKEVLLVVASLSVVFRTSLALPCEFEVCPQTALCKRTYIQLRYHIGFKRREYRGQQQNGNEEY